MVNVVNLDNFVKSTNSLSLRAERFSRGNDFMPDYLKSFMSHGCHQLVNSKIESISGGSSRSDFTVYLESLDFDNQIKTTDFCFKCKEAFDIDHFYENLFFLESDFSDFDVLLNYEFIPNAEGENLLYISEMVCLTGLGVDESDDYYSVGAMAFDARGLNGEGISIVNIENNNNEFEYSSNIDVSAMTKIDKGFSVLSFGRYSVDPSAAASVAHCFSYEVLESADFIFVDQGGNSYYLFTLTDMDILSALSKAIDI